MEANELTVERHPWNWYVPPGAQTLIAGTFPPTKRNWNYDFFYPNKNNLFWKIMAAIAEKPLQYFEGDKAVHERRQLLETLHTGVTDMAARIQRLQNSSLDENIRLLDYMDIFEILDQHPGIRRILLTSSSGPSSAARWFTQYLAGKNIIHRFGKGPRPLRSSFQYKDRSIEVLILYSPSGRAANRFGMAHMTALYRLAIMQAHNTGQV